MFLQHLLEVRVHALWSLAATWPHVANAMQVHAQRLREAWPALQESVQLYAGML